MTAINITPFVDVVLVLLVIFMVTAPMLVKNVLDLKLPTTASGDGQALQTLGVAINRNGNILLNGVLTDEAQLQKTVKETLGQNPDAQAILSADVEVAYGRVVKVIDLIKTAGLNKFAVEIIQKEEGR
jgi:biopolymer transport protein ExbD